VSKGKTSLKPVIDGDVFSAKAINQKIVSQSGQQALSAYGFIYQDVDEFQIAIAEAEEEEK
jgi:anti-sigma regulatory factor (Ser/Thr protein kinase)